MPHLSQCPNPENCPYVEELAQLKAAVAVNNESTATLLRKVDKLQTTVDQLLGRESNNRAWLGGLMWLVGIALAALAFLHDHVRIGWFR